MHAVQTSEKIMNSTTIIIQQSLQKKKYSTKLECFSGSYVFII